MTAYEISEWSDLFVAAAGASAALAGLVFVAVSINVERIVALPGVPNRALQALIQLIAIVIVSLLALAPGQSSQALGVEVTVLMAATVLGSLLLVGRAIGHEGWGGRGMRMAIVALGTVPGLIGGISLLAETGGGLYWLLAWMALAILGAVLNAWVLLIEILR